MMTYHTKKHIKSTPIKVNRTISEHIHNGRKYKLLDVTADNLPYICLRLYNAKGHFIKQFLFEPQVAVWLAGALEAEIETQKQQCVGCTELNACIECGCRECKEQDCVVCPAAVG
jgi:hypothetical protein